MKKLSHLLLCLFLGIGLVTAQTRQITGTVISVGHFVCEDENLYQLNLCNILRYLPSELFLNRKYIRMNQPTCCITLKKIVFFSLFSHKK
jgi:hypothetical protein